MREGCSEYNPSTEENTSHDGYETGPQRGRRCKCTDTSIWARGGCWRAGGNCERLTVEGSSGAAGGERDSATIADNEALSSTSDG